MKHFLYLLLAASVLLCGGCSSEKPNLNVITEKKTETSTLNATSGKNVALVMKTLTNPFFIEMEKGARRGAKEFGVNLLVRTGAQETSITQQIEIIDELIRDKVDAIVIAPASSTELVPVLKKAQASGITIINIDNTLDEEISRKIGLQKPPFISVNNEQGAYLAAKYLSSRLSTPSEVAILEGITSAENSKLRRDGASRAFKENPAINLVAVESANWKIDEAYDVTKNIYRRHPNVGAIFCANDMMALGALKYLADSGRPLVLVAGYDALEEARNAVKNGALTVTVNQQADVQGFLGVKAAVQKMNGETVPPETFVEVHLVTRESLQ